ncbi:MAG: hypothetical protein ACU0GG_20810 [Paracoccaceae bacterium]
MGRIIWISATVLVAVWSVGLVLDTARHAADAPVALTQYDLADNESRQIALGTTGSALATAAFGLSALQPETFNGQIVRDIIEASPLALGEKDRLTAKLLAAQAGNAELPRVLADIRVSLAVE